MKLLLEAPTQDPYLNFFAHKIYPGHPGATLKIWRRSSQLFPSYNLTYTHTHILPYTVYTEIGKCL